MVILLTASIVYIAYYVGLPYWWNRSPFMTVILLIIGNWLLVNVCFHYYMGLRVPPGYPPQGGLIPEAVSICKKCIKPKPPRTHHCSVCNKCVLKMDHHCRILVYLVNPLKWPIVLSMATSLSSSNHLRIKMLYDESSLIKMYSLAKQLRRLLQSSILLPVYGFRCVWLYIHHDFRRRARLWGVLSCAGAGTGWPPGTPQ